jgi:hypothetical protein
MMSNRPDFDEDAPLTLLAETENYAVLVGEDEDGEEVYNVELGGVTLHLFAEEWDELVELIKDASRK